MDSQSDLVSQSDFVIQSELVNLSDFMSQSVLGSDCIELDFEEISYLVSSKLAKPRKTYQELDLIECEILLKFILVEKLQHFSFAEPITMI